MSLAHLWPGQHHAHARRVIVAIGNPEFEGHLVVVEDVFTTGGVTQVKRRATAAKRRDMRRQIGAHAKQRVVKRGVDIALVGAGECRIDGFLHHLVHDRARLAQVVEFLRALHQAQLTDKVWQFAPAVQRRLDLEKQPRRQPHGVHLDTNSFALHTERIEHFPDLSTARCILRIHRDADIFANR